MTTTTRQTWTRTAPGNYTNGRFVVRKEATTHGMKRASNPMWHVYRDGDGAKALSRHRTLQEAQTEADRLVATETPVAPAREARTWDATAADTHTCAGACGETKPAKAFPTTGKDGQRGVECRSCRDARKAA